MNLLLSMAGSVCVIAFMLLLVRSERKRNRYSPFTEKSLRSPALSLEKECDNEYDNLLFYYVLVSITPIISFTFVNTKHPSFNFLLILNVLVIVFSLVRIIGKFKRMRNLSLGRDGEIYTGQELNYLMRQGAWVYHDISYKYGNIDHVIVSKGGIFTVETKTFRKPVNKDGAKEAQAIVKGQDIVFPNYKTDQPIKQAKRHAEHVNKFLFNRTGVKYPVWPVVALPGWYVEIENLGAKNGFLVCNPKRGKALKTFVQQDKISDQNLQRAQMEIEEFARNVQSKSDLTDPDAHKKYSFFFSRKNEERKM